jgi:long-chain acyl-CoA synthetase
MNLASLLLRSAQRSPDAPAIRHGEALYADYAGFWDRTSRLAVGLRRELGLQPGDRVALAMKNSPAYLEVLFACWTAGLVAVPMNAKLHPKEFHYMVEHSGARALFASKALAVDLAFLDEEVESLEQIVDCDSPGYEALFAEQGMPPHPTADDDLAWLFYTSGTTGRPKGAMLSHGNLLTMTLCYFIDVDAAAPEDTLLHAAPMSHGSGLYCFPIVAAGGCQMIAASGQFEPEEIFDILEATPNLCFFAAPTMVTRLTQAAPEREVRRENLKTVVYGGGPMYVADLKKAMARFGPAFVQIYGQGESPMTITSLTRADHKATGHPRYEQRLASAGQAQSAVEVMIADEEDNPLPAGEVGEILCRGRSVMLGYWDDPEATAQTLRGGWLHTGDMGTLDEEGYLTLKDRSKDVIISGGSNIYPREVEEVLLRAPGVAEVSVIGVPHPDWGEEVAAFVTLEPGAAVTAKELDVLCLSEIARFKRPKSYRFLEALPKNNYGKILKTELRRLWKEESGA